MRLSWESAVVIALRDVRGNLTRRELAARAKLGHRTVMSYETGNGSWSRLSAMKLVHLRALCEACGWSLTRFFAYVDDLIRDSTP